jgi:hypothetical protein
MKLFAKKIYEEIRKSNGGLLQESKETAILFLYGGGAVDQNFTASDI